MRVAVLRGVLPYSTPLIHTSQTILETKSKHFATPPDHNKIVPLMPQFPSTDETTKLTTYINSDLIDWPLK